MNQILISEKLYVTPELKRKKKFFKFEFFLSIFLVCILSSYCIYAEYDRNKSEKVSKEILADLNIEKKEKTLERVVVILNAAFEENTEVLEEEVEEETPTVQTTVATDGTEYYSIATINIPSISVNYPILSETTTELLKIAPCKFWGAEPNQVGNFCIVGHNYRNKLFFSKVPNLGIGDIIEITDLSGNTIKYAIYDKYIVEPEDTASTTQLTNGQREITLITCTNDSKQRWIIKAREN